MCIALQHLSTITIDVNTLKLNINGIIVITCSWIAYGTHIHTSIESVCNFYSILNEIACWMGKDAFDTFTMCFKYLFVCFLRWIDRWKFIQSDLQVGFHLNCCTHSFTNHLCEWSSIAVNEIDGLILLLARHQF